MLKISSLICLLPLVSTAVLAQDFIKQPLDKVSMTMSSERWVKTNTAKVQVTINATLTNVSLAQMRKQILDNLSKIAKSEWHITQFNRSQDTSGLEKLFVNAEARVNQSLLSNVNVQAIKSSKPGMKYKINDIDFSPSDFDVQKVKKLVRQDLYKKITSEITQLNTSYKQQNYSLYQVMFVSPGTNYPQRQQLQSYAKKNIAFAAVESYAGGISVSNKVKMTALVSIASNRKVTKSK